uniref:Protein PELPK1-like n=1 Tax=Nelumbo nucifera TaxID=4432 RepID=A0A822XTD9_NELNU|nr:TPA_asm: hypothetical protein HUJ06_023548 [Nelumbo nucifera]
MAYHFQTAFHLFLLLTTLSLMTGHSVLAARGLLDTTFPTVPKLPKPELPTLPTIPSFPKPELPPLPEVPTLPKPELPPVPEIPTLPKPELPPMPEIPTLPKPELPPLPENSISAEAHIAHIPFPFPTRFTHKPLIKLWHAQNPMPWGTS